MNILEKIEINYLNPYHHGYPDWYNTKRIIELKKIKESYIIQTNGLHKNFDIYLETLEEINSFSNSWQANLIYTTGKVIPNIIDITNKIRMYEYLVIQLDIDGAPEEWSLNDKNGNIGIFLGLKRISKGIQNYPFELINIKLMRPLELNFAIKNKKKGRLLLAKKYKEQGLATISGLDRKTVDNI